MLYLDIETIADPALPLHLFETAAIKRDEHVTKYAALSPCLARIVCIGWAKGDREGAIVGGEKDILKDFAPLLAKAKALCGFNLRGFDLPVVWHGFKRHQLPVPQILSAAKAAKPWESPVIDLCEEASWNGKARRDSLEGACVAYGIPSPKDGCDGAGVQGLWLAGEIQKIASYCLGDVRATKALAEKLGVS